MTLAAAITLGSATQTVAGPRPASIVIDAKTGQVMEAEDPDGLRYPASITKMMTLYLVFEALESHRISLRTPVPVSVHAASEAPSKLGVRPGGSFTVEQGILALVTRSANDCATAFGEFLAGSEPRFGKMMTAKARQLGMTRTIYFNANGLPDPRQVTTARDQARLGIALRKHFPQYYAYFSTRSFRYGNQVIGNHNHLLGVVRGVDGIKTGYTRAAGFNLVTSAQADNRSIVAVVLGSPSGGSRDAKMRKIVEAYLPRASRVKGNTDAFVSAKDKIAPAEDTVAETTNENPVQVASANANVDLPDSGPVPATRYEDEASAEDDSNTDMPAQPVVTKSAEVPKVVVPAERSEDMSANVPKVDAVTTASTKSDITGWVIQVGAAPAKSEAMNLLQNVQDKGGKVLRSATPFTVAFVKDNAQIYRARFGGFRNQDAAVGACKVLKRKGISCWASQQ
jgi:D-alanyl-D-alanine carboxypeptidase